MNISDVSERFFDENDVYMYSRLRGHFGIGLIKRDYLIPLAYPVYKRPVYELVVKREKMVN